MVHRDIRRDLGLKGIGLSPNTRGYLASVTVQLACLPKFHYKPRLSETGLLDEQCKISSGHVSDGRVVYNIYVHL